MQENITEGNYWPKALKMQRSSIWQENSFKSVCHAIDIK